MNLLENSFRGIAVRVVLAAALGYTVAEILHRMGLLWR
jgi:hypothetical protein